MIPSFVINLDDRLHRWNNFEKLKIQNMGRISAEDTRCDPSVSLKKYNLELLPGDKLSKYYFKESKGAVGCYLSHYKFWEIVVKNKLGSAIVFEDDADVTDVKNLFNQQKIFDSLNQDKPVLIQFNRRTTQEKLPFWFNGTESYAVNYLAAKSLLELTHDLSDLNGHKLEYTYDIPRTGVTRQLLELEWSDHDSKIDYMKKNCIRYAADKFIGYCSHPAINFKKRLNILIKPYVGLYTNNVKSDVNLNSKQWWNMSFSEIVRETKDL